jgi:hypothetical protein
MPIRVRDRETSTDAWRSWSGPPVVTPASSGIGHALARGLQPVLDVVDDSRPAIMLYERSGWTLAGIQTATIPHAW